MQPAYAAGAVQGKGLLELVLNILTSAISKFLEPLRI